MGAVSDAIRRAPSRFGATVRTSAPVERVLVRNGGSYGVALADGDEIDTDLVVTAIHPQIRFLRHLDASELPDDFVRRIRNWQDRSGTVKVNLALSRAARLLVAIPAHTSSRTTPARSSWPIARLPRARVPSRR